MGICGLAVGTSRAAERQPYAQIFARIDLVRPDPELERLVQSLSNAVTEGRASALDDALSASYATYDCFVDATRACARRGGKAKGRADAARAIRRDLCCIDVAAGRVTPAMRDEAALGFVGAALESATLGRSDVDPRWVCAPAPILFDRRAAKKLAQAAGVEGYDLRLSQTGLAARLAPRKDAASVADIPARAITPIASEASASLPDGWTAIVTPEGAIAFSDQLALADLGAPSLCFAQEPNGQWRIAAAMERKP
jgi:hypothetical protein